MESLILITGGSGYLGSLLAERMAGESQNFISVDILPPVKTYNCGIYYTGDICDYQFIETIFKQNDIKYVFHFATQIDFHVKSQKQLYYNNVESTRNIAKLCKLFSIKKLIFTSSNSIYLGNKINHPFSESDIPVPTDSYGKSKVFCENLLATYQNYYDIVIFRCPNIMDAGRVGMLSILFDFVREGRKCWMIGDGQIHHQCIYAQDFFIALFLSLKLVGSHTFNIGSDHVTSIKEMYSELISHAKSKSTIKSIPANITIPFLKLLYLLRLSPLGPYQSRMLTKDFSFDISTIKSKLNWAPTLTNSQMLIKAYDFYINNLIIFNTSANISASRSKAKMGFINLIKLFS